MLVALLHLANVVSAKLVELGTIPIEKTINKTAQVDGVHYADYDAKTMRLILFRIPHATVCALDFPTMIMELLPVHKILIIKFLCLEFWTIDYNLIQRKESLVV